MTHTFHRDHPLSLVPYFKALLHGVFLNIFEMRRFWRTVYIMLRACYKTLLCDAAQQTTKAHMRTVCHFLYPILCRSEAIWRIEVGKILAN